MWHKRIADIVCVCIRCSGRPEVILVPPVVAPLPPADYLEDVPDDGRPLQTPEAYIIPVERDIHPPKPPYIFTAYLGLAVAAPTADRTELF